MIFPSYAWIIPTGAEKPVKVAFEGSSAVREVENDDWSREIQTYKKMGVAVYHVNPGICVYKNSSLTKSNLPGAAGAWEDTTHSTGWCSSNFFKQSRKFTNSKS